VKGAQVELVCELANISLNKNTVPGDKSALVPSGIRIGMPAMTTRGLTPSEMPVLGGFLDRAVKITQDLDSKVNSKKFKDFKAFVTADTPAIAELKKDVSEFCKPLHFPVAQK